MAVITDKSPNHCANEEENYHLSFFDKLVLLFGCCFIALFLIFLVFIVLYTIIVNPKIPQFSIEEAQISHLELTGPSPVNSYIHIALLSINPNHKLSHYYEELVIYASYKGKKVTSDASITTPFFLDHGETKLLNASLVVNRELIDQNLANELQHDREIGDMELEFKILGKLREKLGKYCMSQPYSSEVRCTIVMLFGPMNLSGTIDTECDFAL